MQPWQAYLNKFHDTKIKKSVDSAWQEYLKTLPKGKKPEKSIFEIRNRVAKELYADETDEVKQEVEEHRQSMRDGPDESADTSRRNKGFQKSVFVFPLQSECTSNSHVCYEQVDRQTISYTSRCGPIYFQANRLECVDSRRRAKPSLWRKAYDVSVRRSPILTYHLVLTAFASVFMKAKRLMEERSTNLWAPEASKAKS